MGTLSKVQMFRIFKNEWEDASWESNSSQTSDDMAKVKVILVCDRRVYDQMIVVTMRFAKSIVP